MQTRTPIAWLAALALLGGVAANRGLAQKPPDLPVRTQVQCLPDLMRQLIASSDESVPQPVTPVQLTEKNLDIAQTFLLPFELLPAPRIEEEGSPGEESEPRTLPSHGPLQFLLYRTEPISTEAPRVDEAREPAVSVHTVPTGSFLQGAGINDDAGLIGNLFLRPTPAPAPAPAMAGGEQQVQLKVCIVELGADLDALLGMRASASGSSKVASICLDDGRLLQTIQAFRKTNQVKCLALPQLVTRNGVKARFFAGGEIPVVTAPPVQAISGVHSIPYGLGIDLTPVILSPNQIRLQASIQLSRRDPSLGNGPMKGVQTRTAQSTAEMRVGQTMTMVLEGDKEDRTRLVLVTPEIVPVVAAAPQPLRPQQVEDQNARPTVTLQTLFAEVDSVGLKRLQRRFKIFADREESRDEVLPRTQMAEVVAELERLVKQGHGFQLSRPEISVLSGQYGSVHFTQQQHVKDDGKGSLEVYNIGVRLGVQPTLRDGGELDLVVEPEVSALWPKLGTRTGSRTGHGRTTQRLHLHTNVSMEEMLFLHLPQSRERSIVLLVVPTADETSASTSNANRRMTELLNQSEDLRQLEHDWQKVWFKPTKR